MGNKLNPNQVRSIKALLTTTSVTAAAEAAGIGRSTLHRYLRDPDFVRELRTAEGEALATLSRSLLGLGEAAVKAFQDALDPSTPIATRLRAAQLVTDARLLNLIELTSLEERVRALEENRNATH